MKVILRGLGLVLLAFFALCVLTGSLFLNRTSANAVNSGAMEQHDSKILQYYHEANLEENFEDNKVNI